MMRAERSGVLQWAMSDGLKLGGLFALQAVALLLYRWGFLSVGLYLVAGVAAPILIVVLGQRYREQQLGGYATYMQMVAYLSWLLLLSLLIHFLSHYLTFRYLFGDPTFVGMMEESLEMMEQILGDSGDVELVREAYSRMTPLRVATNMATTTLFFGIIYVYIVALFLRKKRS